VRVSHVGLHHLRVRALIEVQDGIPNLVGESASGSPVPPYRYLLLIAGVAFGYWGYRLFVLTQFMPPAGTYPPGRSRQVFALFHLRSRRIRHPGMEDQALLSGIKPLLDLSANRYHRHLSPVSCTWSRAPGTAASGNESQDFCCSLPFYYGIARTCQGVRNKRHSHGRPSALESWAIDDGSENHGL
jgi:hypothetical protein